MPTFAALDIDESLLFGVDREVIKPAMTARMLDETKASLKARCQETLTPVMRREAVSQTVFWNTIAALGDTAPTTEIYVEMQRLLVLELTATFYFDAMNRAGRGDQAEKRYEKAIERVAERVPPFAEMVELAIRENEVDFTADRAVTDEDILWIA